MDKDYSHTIEEIIEKNPARVFIKRALKGIIPTKNVWECTIFVFLCLAGALVSYKVAFVPETVELVSKLCGHLIEIQLALFSCVFAVYSILLAFLSNDYMKRLSKIKGTDGTSSLKQYTTYYESVLFLFFVNIAATGALLLATDFLPVDASLTTTLNFENKLAFFGLFLYFSFSFRVFYEIKSTIYNTIILFRYSIVYRFMSFANEDEANNNDSLNVEGKDK